MVAFIAGRGEHGVTSAELTDVFLHPVSASPELCARLIRKVLAGDPRIVERPDGKWAVPALEPRMAAGEGFCAVETLDAAGGVRRCIVEWAGVRIDLQGRTVETRGSAIRPEPWPAGLVVPQHLRRLLRQAPSPAEAVRAAVEFCRGATIVSFRTGSFQEGAARVLVSSGTDAPLLSLEKLGRRLFGSAVRSAEALATRLNVPARDPGTAAERAEFTAEIVSALLSVGEKLGLAEPAEWAEQQHPQRIDVDFSSYEFDRDDLENLPESPGIYIMRDANGDAVYVGKAANLRERVKSYFRARVERDEKTDRILEAVSRVEVEEAGSELEALLAEYRTIRDLQPPINVQYDVHERPAAAKGPPWRWVLVLPSVDPESAEVFLLDGRRAMKQVRAARNDPETLRPVVARFFFGESPVASEAEGSEETLQIAWSWLERNKDRANGFDVDVAGGSAEAMRLLKRYLREEPSGRRVFHV